MIGSPSRGTRILSPHHHFNIGNYSSIVCGYQDIVERWDIEMREGYFDSPYLGIVYAELALCFVPKSLTSGVVQVGSQALCQRICE